MICILLKIKSKTKPKNNDKRITSKQIPTPQKQRTPLNEEMIIISTKCVYNYQNVRNYTQREKTIRYNLHGY